MPRPVNYWDYLRIDELLDLQGGVERDEARLGNEEVLFITVHQVFELWFKLVIRELAAARDLFRSEPVAEQELSGVVERLQRVTTIFRVAASHFEVVETLSTRAFLAFRNKLLPASGYQSAQMRRMEILLGLEESERVPLGVPGGHLRSLLEPDGSESASGRSVRAQLADRPTLKEAITSWLARTPIDGTEHDAPDADERLSAFLDRFLECHAAEVDASLERALDVSPPEAHERLRAMYAREIESVRDFFRAADADGRRRARVRAAMLFIELYRELPLLAWPREVLASLIQLEQAFLIFRQRHARMVERVIGRRPGTGGSAGVEYLDKTALEYRVFRDLWAIRTLLVRADAAPPLENPGFYSFRGG